MGVEEYGSGGVWEWGSMGVEEYGSGGVWEWRSMGVEEYRASSHAPSLPHSVTPTLKTSNTTSKGGTTMHKTRRLNRILGKDGKALIVAMDHAAIQGPSGLERPGELIPKLIAVGPTRLSPPTGWPAPLPRSWPRWA